MNRKPKVLIIYKIFNGYRKPIFDKLNKIYDFLFLHSTNNSGIKQERTFYSQIVKSFKYGKKETNVYLSVIKHIIKFKPDIIIHEFNPSILSLHTSYIISKLLNIKFVCWGHGFNRENSFEDRKKFKSKVRLFYLNRADAVLMYGQRGKEDLSNYISKEKIFVAQNTLDTSKLLNIKEHLEKRGIDKVKKTLNFKFKYNLIYIGRLLKSKNPEYLLHLLIEIKNRLDNDIAVHFIGDGEMKHELINIANSINLKDNVFFYGSIHDDNITGKYLFASDLMVMPGYLGLSINHAFCFNCPVVSFKRGPNGPFHSPEVEYVIQNKTGYLAKNYNINDMADFVVKYLQNNNLQTEIKSNINFLINNVCSMNNMIQGITDCVEYLTDQNNNRR